MKKKIKKAFTLVELLVVIAILAILATVSIIGYNSFINKAKMSADEQICTQYNIALKADNVVEEIKNIQEATDVLDDNGFYIGEFKTTYKGYIFAYDIQKVQFVLIDEKGTCQFPKEYDGDSKNWQLFLNPDAPQGANGVSNYFLQNSGTMSNFNLLTKYSDAVTIDLNQHVLAYKNDDVDSKVTLNNGFYTVGLSTLKTDTFNGNAINAKADNSNAVVLEKASDVDAYTYNDSSNDEILIENKTFLGLNSEINFAPQLNKKNMKLTFKNCKFENLLFVAQYGKEGAELILDGCTFNNRKDDAFAINAEPKNGPEYKKLTVKNCTIRSYRGILINFTSTEMVFENNIFDLYTYDGDGSKQSCIQFAYAWDDSNVINTLTPNITIKNNVVVKANSFILVHKGVDNDATIGKYVEKTKAGLTFENNTFAKFKGNAVVNYPGYTGSDTYKEFIDWLNQNVK